MPARLSATRRSQGMPVAIRAALALAFPFIAALTVVGTYLEKKLVVGAASLGFLTVANLLGVGFLVSLAVHVLNTRDLSFLKQPQVLVFAVIGLAFLAS